MTFKLAFEVGFDRRVIFSYPTRGVQLEWIKEKDIHNEGNSKNKGTDFRYCRLLMDKQQFSFDET